MDGLSKEFFRELCVLFLVSSVWMSYADTEFGENANKMTATHVDLEKRYLGALAKNGRLPKFHSGNKRTLTTSSSSAHILIQDQKALNSARPSDLSVKNSDTLGVPPDSWKEDKRHIGAFLQAHGRPNFAKASHIRKYRSVAYSSMPFDEYASDDSLSFEDPSDNDLYWASNEDDDSGWRASDKRNIAALARLGRLNAVRYGRPYSGHKREFVITNNDDDDKDSAVETSCTEEINPEYGDGSKALVQQKRYIAALARTGRLPPWHPRRLYWDSKRDSNTYWPQFLAHTASESRKGSWVPQRIVKSTNYIRCKSDSSEFGRSKEVIPKKRNIQWLARKGLLSRRPLGASS